MNLDGDLLVKIRVTRGMSQKELADKLGYSQTTIGLIETGQRTPTRTFCIKLADKLGLTPEEIHRLRELPA